MFFYIFKNSFLYNYNINNINNPTKINSYQHNKTNNTNIKTNTLIFKSSIQISPIYNQTPHQHKLTYTIKYFKQTIYNIYKTNYQTSPKPKINKHNKHTKNYYYTFYNIILQLNHNKITYNNTKNYLNYRYIIKT